MRQPNSSLCSIKQIPNMIKTLRIASVVAAILAVIFLVLAVVFGVRSDERVEGFLNSPSVIEQFNTAIGNQAKTSESRSSPLVQQATAFALYLNPKPEEPSAVRDMGGIMPLSLPTSPRRCSHPSARAQTGVYEVRTADSET